MVCEWCNKPCELFWCNSTCELMSWYVAEYKDKEEESNGQRN